MQKIEIPEGFELQKVSENEYQIVRKKESLPKTWEEFAEKHPIGIEEAYVNSSAEIRKSDPCGGRRATFHYNSLPSKEIAEAFLELGKLIHLRDFYRDGWKPDWDSSDIKWCILPNKVKLHDLRAFSQVLSFPTEEIAMEFYNNFKDSIEKLKVLY